MNASRRAFLTGCAALSASMVTPEIARAAVAQAVAGARAHDWTLAVADLNGDVPEHAMHLVRGRAPEGLAGALYRNGPAMFRRPGGSSAHWFDGDGLMRRFRVGDGRATLAARFADTPKRRTETELDAVVTPGFATPGDSRARIGSPDDANAANTAVLAAGDAVWALWEGGSPLALDPETLATRDFVTLRPDLKGMPFQAHPRSDPNGDVWNIGLAGDRAVVWRLAADGALKAAEVIRLPRPSYLHDFTATSRHLIFVLQPWVFASHRLPFASALEWRPEMGTEVVVVDKDDLSRRRTFDLPAFAHFHLGDAWEEADGTIRFDTAASDDPRFGIEGAADLLRGVARPDISPARLALITLRPDGRAEMLDAGVAAEFPKGDPRRAGLRRDLTVHVAGEGGGRPLPTGLAVRDWSTGREDAFDFGEDHVVEEMVFAPKPGGGGERDAWLVGPSINLRDGVTELHVFDAARVSGGPVASWRADVALPAGFHGAWTA
ncbi:MAG: carotenoid oxygenase family protein [Brevundimonas sp.]